MKSSITSIQTSKSREPVSSDPIHKAVDELLGDLCKATYYAGGVELALKNMDRALFLKKLKSTRRYLLQSMKRLGFLEYASELADKTEKLKTRHMSLPVCGAKANSPVLRALSTASLAVPRVKAKRAA